MTPDGQSGNGRSRRDHARAVPRVILVLVLLAAAVVILGLRRHHTAPVALAGKVDNHGTRTVRDGTTIKVLLEDTSFSPTLDPAHSWVS